MITKRITGERLQMMRADLFAVEPFCRPCRSKGRLTPATIRDHIVPLEEGGTEAKDNTQPICDDCHKIKIAEESARGVKRSRY